MKKYIHSLISRKLFYGFALSAMRISISEKFRFLAATEQISLHARKENQLKLLGDIVSKASSGSVFHRQRLAQSSILSASIASMADVAKLPILEKSDLRSLSIGDYCTNKGDIFSARATSGTSGQPVKIYLSREKQAWELAARKLVYQGYGLELGDREARLWGGSGLKTLRGVLRDAVLNRRVFDMVDASRQVLDRVLEVVRYKPDYLYGYSSLILKLAEMVEESGQYIPGLTCVICTAENIFPHQVKFLEGVFNCPVYIEYGCTEVDIIASSCSAGVLHVNMEKVLLETVPTEDGYCEVIISDLQNSLFPVIRYRLGDLVKLEERECVCGRNSQVITEVVGRTQKRFVKMAGGEVEHSVVFSHMFAELDELGFAVKRFQIRQLKVGHFSIIVEMSEIEHLSEVSAFLGDKFRQRYGNEVHVEILYTEDFPSSEGKFSYFIGMD